MRRYGSLTGRSVHSVLAKEASSKERSPTTPPPAAASRTLPGALLLEQQWLEARTAFDAADYPTAIRLLTRLVEYPGHPRRAEAQELLGLAR